MKMRIADWHGEQAAKGYQDWSRSGRDEDLAKFLRHTSIADRMWWEVA